MPKRLALSLVLPVLLSGCSQTVSSGNVSTSDSAFGTGGIASATFTGTITKLVVTKPAGLVYVGGVEFDGATARASILRFTRDGVPDAAFGGSGKVSLGNFQTLVDFALDSAGRVTVAGETLTVANNGAVTRAPALARIAADGASSTSLDLSALAIEFGGAGLLALGPLSIQSDGKIVATAYGLPAAANQGFGLARYGLDLSLDSSFGASGIRRTPIAATHLTRVTGIAAVTDGTVAVAGPSCPEGDASNPVCQIYLARFTDGTLNTSGFTTASGYVGTPTSALGTFLIDSAGNILFGASFAGIPGVLRYVWSGTVDSTFASSGLLSAPGTRFMVQPDGKLVFAASIRPAAVEVSRFGTDGKLDTAFGSSGTSTLTNAGGPLGTPFVDYQTSATDSSSITGIIVAAMGGTLSGQVGAGAPTGSSIIVQRIKP